MTFTSFKWDCIPKYFVYFLQILIGRRSVMEQKQMISKKFKQNGEECRRSSQNNKLKNKLVKRIAWNISQNDGQ